MRTEQEKLRWLVEHFNLNGVVHEEARQCEPVVSVEAHENLLQVMREVLNEPDRDMQQRPERRAKARAAVEASARALAASPAPQVAKRQYRVKVKGGDWHLTDTLPAACDLDSFEAIEDVAAPVAQPAEAEQAEAPDSTPLLHVGESSFEGWYADHCNTGWGTQKQLARDAYAAGMGDPLVTYATQPTASNAGEREAFAAARKAAGLREPLLGESPMPADRFIYESDEHEFDGWMLSRAALASKGA